MGTTRAPRARIVAMLTSVSLVAGLGLASVSPAGAAGTASGKTGPQPPGLGLGSKAALAQTTCNETGHTNLQYKGDSGAPFCVNPWKEGANNGGATAPGALPEGSAPADEWRVRRDDRVPAERGRVTTPNP